MIPPKHEQEEARLAALNRYHILDTPYEKEFDDIVRLLSQICQVPLAAINLIDRHRQWFKAHVGARVRQTPLNISICAHAILQPGIFIIPDTTQDDRFCDNPFVVGDPHLRFYAGALLESSDGYPLGTLCVLDYQPRELTPLQKEALTVLSHHVMTQMELRLQLEYVEDLNQRLRRTITESHHRIKNNLQVLSVLVEILTSQGRETVPTAELTRLGQHIQALTVLHDLLTRESHQDAVLESLAVGDALERLMLVMRPLLGDRTLNMEMVEVRLSVRQITALIVLVHELLSNAVKHGEGDITLAVAVDGESVQLCTRDRGPGFPADFEPQVAANTGLGLIESLACWDLRGHIEYTNHAEGGAVITIVFPIAE